MNPLKTSRTTQHSVQFAAVPSIPAELRSLYLASLIEPQELYVETRVTAGEAVTISLDVTNGGECVVGYIVVHDMTIVELFITDDALRFTTSIMDALFQNGLATRALCKSFDSRTLAAITGRNASMQATGLLFRTIHDDAFTPNPEVKERPGRTGDIDAIVEMHDGFFKNRNEVERDISDRRLTIYESRDGELLGCGIVTPITDGRSSSRETVDIGMVVARPHRGRGIGAYIVANLKHRCLTNGIRPICGCDINNTASRRALENGGFTTDHTLIEFGYTNPTVDDLGETDRDRTRAQVPDPDHSEQRFESVDESDLATIAFLHDCIYDYNVTATGIDNGRTFTFVQRDDDNTIVAGAHGWTWGGSAWLDVLWVADELRSSGTGSALLLTVESVARTQDCAQLALATHTFQASGFYESHGFEIVGYLDQHPSGHGQYIMRKALV